MSLNFDKWIVGENVSMNREYVVHTEYPRFIAEIIHHSEKNFSDLREVTFIDELRPIAPDIAKLMREAGEAIADYYERLEDE